MPKERKDSCQQVVVDPSPEGVLLRLGDIPSGLAL